MSEFLQFLLTGITTGAIYGLIALGFNVLYNATDLINFAQGEFVMLGGLCFYSLGSALGWPAAAAFATAVCIVSLLGLLLERVALRPVKKPEPLTLIIITVGASIFLRGVAMRLWARTRTASRGSRRPWSPFGSGARRSCPRACGSWASLSLS